MKLFFKRYIFLNKYLAPYVRLILVWADGIRFIMSLVFLFALVYQYGFQLTHIGTEIIGYIHQWVWITFLIVNTLHLCFDSKNIGHPSRKITWVLNGLLYLTLFPVLFKNETAIGLHYFSQHSMYQLILLTLLSLLNLSGGVVRLLGRRTNPSLIFASSFLFLILIGTCLLMFPKSTYHGISLIDALFVSTSAVCITGLSSVDIPTVFTSTGQLFILLLIQIGGLGVMTITSFFALFFMGNTSIYNQLVVKDIISSQSLNTLLSTILYVLGFTLVIELTGALFLYITIHGTLGMTTCEEIFFVVFHAVSAFCNAGFSTLSGNLGNSTVLHNHSGFYMVISFLVILGGIGYPILVNFYQILSYEIKRIYHRVIKDIRYPRKVHLYNLNTRIVVRMTLFLLLAGTITILLSEWNRSLAEMRIHEKVVQAFFNAACPRTAGFNSVNLTVMGFHTLLIYMLLMVIGGGAQSTAGGVKVNVFAVLILNMRAVLRNTDKVMIFNRELSSESIRRSNATFIFYLTVVSVSFFLITFMEPDLPTFSLLFECVSALSTVGASLDLTPLLCDESKFLLVWLMFVGRVGLLTLIASLMGNPKKERYQYPSDHIIIN